MFFRERFDAVALLLGMIFLVFVRSSNADAQDMEARAYSAVPIDTNFLIGGYERTTGSVSLDPSLPIQGIQASINTGLIAYDRTFDLFGQAASAAILIPYFQAQVSGKVFDAPNQVTRKGLGDIRVRFTENLIGNPAQTPAEFAQREPSTTLGVSLTVDAPTGDYNPQHLINISSHRWAVKPEIGGSQPIGNWFIDGAAGVWLFTVNPDFFGGHTRGEDPIWSFQTHVGYNFRPGLWLSADATHYLGGDSIIDGINSHDFQAATRVGATLSIPIGEGFSAKVAWASWLAARRSGDYNTIGFQLQYRWFDP